jgi:hypothetical protein
MKAIARSTSTGAGPRRRYIDEHLHADNLGGDQREAPAYLCAAIVKLDSSRVSKIRERRCL